MRVVQTNAELRAFHADGAGLIFNDFTSGPAGARDNVLHAAACAQVSRMLDRARPESRPAVRKLLFSDMNEAQSWLVSNRGTEGHGWKCCGTCRAGRAESAVPLAAPGSRLAGYRLEEQAGSGGMAVVFRAWDERLGRQVALKVLAPALAADPGFRQRFLRESRAAAAIDDPHITPVYEAGEADGVLFIAMRYVPGGDLRSLLGREGPLQAARAAALISSLASALDAAHAAGLVHRDVKPANILVDVRPGRPDHVYLSDFGLSKAVLSASGLTSGGQFLGTVNYCAPEQIQGKAVDGRADQFALACTAFELLAGEAPFQRAESMAVLYAHLSEPPPSLAARRPDLPTLADRVFALALAKAPENRYASCGEFADALRGALGLEAYHSGTGGQAAGGHLPLPAGHPVTEVAQAGAARSSDTVTTASPPASPPLARTGPGRPHGGQAAPVRHPLRRRRGLVALAGIGAVAVAAIVTAAVLASPPSKSAGATQDRKLTAAWQFTGSMSSGHANWYNGGFAELPDGRVLAISGAGSGGLTPTAEIYDPATGRWTSAGSLHDARYAFGRPSVLPDGDVLVAGGHDANVVDYATAELYDPATNQWTLTGSLNTSRRYPVQVELANGEVLVATGSHGLPTCTRYLSSAELYNPATGRWTYTGSTLVPRESATAIRLADGRVLLAGGYNGGGSACTNTDPVDTEIYDPATGQWSSAGDLPHGWQDGAMVLLPDHRVLMVDGSQQGSGNFAEAVIFNPATNQWSEAAAPFLPRSGADATLLPDGDVLVSQGGQARSEIYDPATNTWSLSATALDGYDNGQAFLLPGGKVLLVGGSTSTGASTKAELYTAA